MTTALRATAALILTLLTGALLVASAAPAAAHASIVSSSPADGAHFDKPPDRLIVDLSEPVTVVEDSAAVITPAGDRIRLSGVRLENGNRRLVMVPADRLADNAYLATVRTVSADTHVVSLSIRFTVGSVTDLSGVPAAPAAGRGYLRWGWFARTAVYLGVILSAGLLLATRMVWPEVLSGNRFARTHQIGAGVLLLGLLGRFVLLCAARGGGIATIDSGTVGDVLATGAGWSTAVAVIANLAVLLGITRLCGGLWAAYAAAGTAWLAVTLGGHGGSTTRWPVAFIDTLVHVYAVSVWFGGVAVLALVGPVRARIARWHRVAAGHVALVVTSGVILAVLQVAPVHALVTTTYGVLLLVKVAVVIAAVALGWVVYRRYVRSDRRHGIIMGELVLAVVIASATAVLSSTTPARESYTTQVTAGLDFGVDRRLAVEIDTVRRGDQAIVVRYRPASGGVVAAEGAPEVSIDLSSIEADIARLPVTLTRQLDNGVVSWRSDGLIVPAPGRWKVTVRFDAGDGPKLASFRYRVR